MIRTRRLLPAIASAIVLSGLMLAQAPQASSPRTAEQQQSYRKAMEEADQKIADEVKAHSELMKNLEYLTTQIGPRLDRFAANAGGQRLDAEALSGLRRRRAPRNRQHRSRLDARQRDGRDHQSHPAAHWHSRLWLEQGDRRRSVGQGRGARHSEALGPRCLQGQAEGCDRAGAQARGPVHG